MREPIYRDSHFYTLLALFAVCAVLYYFGELVILFGWETLRWDIFYTVHDPHRMLFLGPIIYASLYFRLKGAIAANVLSLIIFLPRAFLISPYPDATLRMLIFVLVAIMLSLFTVFIIRQRDRRSKLIAALKHSEEKNRVVLEQLYDSYYEMDLKGKYIFVNDSVCRSMGYSREELIGSDYRLTVHSDDIKRVRDAFNQVFRTGEPNKGFEHKVIRKDGSIMVVESSISMRRNEHGDVVGFRSVSRNVTEHRQAEFQIKERMKELKAFYSLAEIVSKQDITLDNLYQEVTDVLPASWQYPEITYARMIIGNSEFRTANFADSEWNQAAPVIVWGLAIGRIDVGYLEERPVIDEGPFMKEERILLNAIAERIGHITERRQSEEVLRRAEEKYRTLVENINDVFYTLDSQGNITYVSPVVEQLTQYKVRDLIGKPFTPLIYPDDLPALLESLNRLVSGQLEPWEFRIVDKDGRIIFVRTSSRPILENGKVVGITALMTDITERKKADEALRSAEEKYRTLVENINDIFYMLDNKGNITYISPVVERLTLYKVNELIGKPVFPLIHPDDLPGLLESVNQLVSGQLVPWEFRILDKDGRVIYVRSSRQLLYKDGKVIGITAVMSDITERKKMEQKLEEMAMHDNLTGLPNRVLLADRFKIAAALARRNKGRFAVMSLDLDKFKTINDTLGHDAGDQVLKTISKRITGIIRASDTLARVGGDEFILLMQETNHLKDSAAIAQKVLDSFAEKLSIDGHNIELSTSIGIAVYPEDGEDLAILVKKSDAAMYFSKGHGRNRYKFFNEGDVSIGGDHKSAKG